MNSYSFDVVIEKEPEDEGYFAYSPSLPGCFSNGRTVEEAGRNVREAVQQHVASLVAHQQVVPQRRKPGSPPEADGGDQE
jgi:predicted RNase H-like HicB family nuclease